MRGDILHVRAGNVLEFLAPGRGWNGPPLPVNLISKPVVLAAGGKFGNIPDPTKITPCEYGFDRTGIRRWLTQWYNVRPKSR